MGVRKLAVKLGKWLLRKGAEEAPTKSCGSCVRFDLIDPEDEDGIDGYCVNDWNPDYAGQHTSSTSWCPNFTRTEQS